MSTNTEAPPVAVAVGGGRSSAQRVVGQAVLFAVAAAFVSLLSALAKALIARELPASAF